MKLSLHELLTMHPKLWGNPIGYSRIGALAMQRSGHFSPVSAAVDHDGAWSNCDVEWTPQDLGVLSLLDSNRVTEDGAETVALAYVHALGTWSVKRRLQRGDSADWLLEKDGKLLALEVSGTAGGDANARLSEKKQQVARCSLPVELLAVVVAFERPSILAGRP